MNSEKLLNIKLIYRNLAFLYSNNEQSDRDIKKRVQLQLNQKE